MIGRPGIREEANAIVAHAFRNGFLEELHAGSYSELLENESLSRIIDAEMKKLMIEPCERVTQLLEMKERDPEAYWDLAGTTIRIYTKHWVM